GEIRPVESQSIAPGLKIRPVNFQRTEVCVKDNNMHQKSGRPAFFCSPRNALSTNKKRFERQFSLIFSKFKFSMKLFER
ncbi:MAG TPA: hypothetical protein VNI84_12730, partial [Pyrinomonadaceae bacterium]|nr:hypothetical protein [Pyrinomonadaceae bacterium]